MNHKIKPLSIAFLLIASCFVSISEASAEPTSSPNRLVMCVRKTWASTDKCKDPAVASKKAPKDLKKEIERLASLTVTSFEQLKIERGGETPTIKALTHEQRQAAEVSSASCGNKALILARIMDSSNIYSMKAFGTQISYLSAPPISQLNPAISRL